MGRADAYRFLAWAGPLPGGSSCIVGLQSLLPFRQKLHESAPPDLELK